MAQNSLRLTIVCENTVGRPIPALGEHGFACLVETAAGTWLFDTGRGQSLLPNLAALGVDPHRIDGVILSHGHNDHTGGLLALLQQVGPRPVYAHPEIFAERYWQGLHERRDIRLPHTRAELESAGAQFRFSETLTSLAPGLFFSGSIPRRCEAETGDPHLVRPAADAEGFVADAFNDDAAIAIETPRGLVVLLGCAHAGMINTLEHFRRELAAQPIHAVIGGSHLGPAGDAQFSETLGYLGRLPIDRIGLSHCTGQIRAAQLYAQFPNRVFFASVGTVFQV